MAKKKSWVEKREKKDGVPKIVKEMGKMSKWGEGPLIIAAPSEIDEIMRKVPKGKLVTTADIRDVMVAKYSEKGVNICCPLTTGIFCNISAFAAEEECAEGKKRTTPYWRTLKAKGMLNPKFPGGTENQKALLEEEGHEVFAKGKNLYVKDFESKIAKIDTAKLKKLEPIVE